VNKPFQIKSTLHALHVESARKQQRAHFREIIEVAEAGGECECDVCNAVMVPLICRTPSWLDKNEEWIGSVVCRHCGAKLVDESFIGAWNMRGKIGGDS